MTRHPRGAAAAPVWPEIVRALAALGTVALWGGVFLLLVGCTKVDVDCKTGKVTISADSAHSASMMSRNAADILAQCQAPR
jgi:hypothetical protein